MIHFQISSDIASIAIKAGDTVFTWENDIGSDGGFDVHIYQSREDIMALDVSDLEFFTKLGRYDVFRCHGDWHFVREGDLDLPKLKPVKVETTLLGEPYTSTEWVPV